METKILSKVFANIYLFNFAYKCKTIHIEMKKTFCIFSCATNDAICFLINNKSMSAKKTFIPGLKNVKCKLILSDSLICYIYFLQISCFNSNENEIKKHFFLEFNLGALL